MRMRVRARILNKYGLIWLANLKDINWTFWTWFQINLSQQNKRRKS